MAFVLLFVGIALVISAIQGTLSQLGSLLKGDLTGKGNFLFWLVCILVVGSVGYVQRFRVLSDTFMALLIIVIVIANQNGNGFFSKLTSALDSSENTPSSSGIATTTTPNTVTLENGSSSSSSGSGGSGGEVGEVEEVASIAALA
jgi:hypothetical protein